MTRLALPLSLRISVTDRCQLRCVYCMPPSGTPMKPRDEILSFEEIVRFVQLVKSEFGVSKVRITGGDPLVREGVVELVEMLARQGVDDLALTTNGQLLAEMAADLKRAGLRRVNVSLDSLNEQTFQALTGGGELQRTIEGIEAACRNELTPVKINTVVLGSHNIDELTGLARFAMDRSCQIRFLELMPIGWARRVVGDLFVSTSEVRDRLTQSFSLQPLPYGSGETSRDFLASDLSGRRGTIGFISGQTQPFCNGCTRIRLTSTGRLISCLARGKGPNVRELLRSDSAAAAVALREAVATELSSKPKSRAFDALSYMASVGG